MDCIQCRGRMLCSLQRCPMLPILKAKNINLRELSGHSPPSIFVGRANYPLVRVGPALPLAADDAAIYDMPEAWVDLPVEKVLEFRTSLILGNFKADVRTPEQTIREMSMYSRPVEIEMVLDKPPRPKTIFDDVLTPFGPSAPARSIKICSTPSAPRIVERVCDDDLPAKEAVSILYRKGIAVSHIQRLLSAGSLGRRRKLVPTRWAITAVDDMLSKALLEEVKGLETIDKYRVFHLKKSRNLFMALLLPSPWSFEWGEAWYPDTTWNRSRKIAVITDHESFHGRNSYAKLGGCYYASRLATAEYLSRIGGQATAIVWREIYPGFKIAIGVWFVREMLRKMYAERYMEFDTLSEALSYLNSISSLGIARWVEKSGLITGRQKMLTEFGLWK